MKQRRYYNVQCHICGRFVRPDADYHVPYGGYYDMEPKYPEHFCPKCIERREKQCREYGEPPQTWIKSRWGRRLAEELGFAEDTGGWWVKQGGGK